MEKSSNESICHRIKIRNSWQCTFLRISLHKNAKPLSLHISFPGNETALSSAHCLVRVSFSYSTRSCFSMAVQKKEISRQKEREVSRNPRNLPEVSQSGKWIEEMFQLSRQMSPGIAGDLDNRSCPPFPIFCPAQEIVTRLHQVTHVARAARTSTHHGPPWIMHEGICSVPSMLPSFLSVRINFSNGSLHDRRGSSLAATWPLENSPPPDPPTKRYYSSNSLVGERHSIDKCEQVVKDNEILTTNARLDRYIYLQIGRI